jgi:hypothetical protein
MAIEIPSLRSTLPNKRKFPSEHAHTYASYRGQQAVNDTLMKPVDDREHFRTKSVEELVEAQCR